jgi:Transglycosylase SLT domain
MSWRDGYDAQKWIPVISAAEINNGIPKGLSARQCYQESRFNDLARNPTSGAVGLFQLLPKYFPGAGSNPAKDIGTATKYLASLAKRFGGDYQLGLAAYDWGPGSVSKWQKSGGTFETMPKETQDYVSQIMADVPVPGVLCKTPSLPVPQVTGFQVKKSSSVASSANSSAKSLFSRVTSIFRKPQAPPLELPSADLSPRSVPISFPISKDNSMSTPNPTAPTPSPALLAASPFLKTVLMDLKVMANTILTGDPAQIGLRAGPAFGIFLNQVVLLEPGLLSAEESVVNTDVGSKIDGIIAKLP